MTRLELAYPQRCPTAEALFSAPLWQVQRLCTHNALPFVLHPLIVSLLYHTLKRLSRGFRKKFATFFLISDTRPLLRLVTRPIALSLPSPRLELRRPQWWLLAIVSPLSFSPLRACFHCSWWLSLSRFPLLTFFVRYCIAHNPLLLQPLGHWFTFIYRKHEHLAVEDFIVKVLPDSRGSCLCGFCLASLSVIIV